MISHVIVVWVHADRPVLSAGTACGQKGRSVCVTDGASNKRCSFEGSVKGGVCITHGAIMKRKRCSFEGWTNGAARGGSLYHPWRKSGGEMTGARGKEGVCVTHGAKVTYKRCRYSNVPDKVSTV